MWTIKSSPLFCSFGCTQKWTIGINRSTFLLFWLYKSGTIGSGSFVIWDAQKSGPFSMLAHFISSKTYMDGFNNLKVCSIHNFGLHSKSSSLSALQYRMKWALIALVKNLFYTFGFHVHYTFHMMTNFF